MNEKSIEKVNQLLIDNLHPHFTHEIVCDDSLVTICLLNRSRRRTGAIRLETHSVSARCLCTTLDKQHNPRLRFVYRALALLYKTRTQQNNRGILSPTQSRSINQFEPV